MITKLTRMYHIRHVMVEGGYITPQQFMAEVLEYIESLDMKPPERSYMLKGEMYGMEYDSHITRDNTWEPEDEKNQS